MVLSESVATPQVRWLLKGEKPSRGFVRRSHPVIPEYVIHASWWPVQEWEKDGQEEGLIFLWIPRKDNLAYERSHKRTRFCITYQGKICEHITPERQKSCHNIVRRVIVAVKC